MAGSTTPYDLRPLSLEELQFDNRFTRELPADPEKKNSRRQVVGACYSRVSPTPVARPSLVAHSPEVAELLELSPESIRSNQFVQVFAGNALLAGMDPFAMCYGGHQFGNWAGQLGDGRAINLGEVVNRKGQRWTLQLKGAGPTPYSRTADGLAVLRSSVREFLCSEAMHHLGVPTTRALSLVLTGEKVVRDMFYDGNPEREPGAVVCRVAPSFTRFGNFEIFASREDLSTLRQLVDYTIRTDFPHLGEPSQETYGAMFGEVCRKTATMIVQWMRVGFVHGVMNTDNMSILGLTIDYGPYGWLENYDPDWTPNTTDAGQGRYRFGNQPQIAQWNLLRLASALYSLFAEEKPLQEGLDAYVETFEREWQAMMAAKLGLRQWNFAADPDLVRDLLSLLQEVETDMTLFFRQLAEVKLEGPHAEEEASDDTVMAILRPAYYAREHLSDSVRKHLFDWLCAYRNRVHQDGTSDARRRERMNGVNPLYVLRNYLAQLAIDKSQAGDHSMVHELLDVLRNPYTEQPGKAAFAAKRPEWARHRPGCSMLSCSS